MRYDVFIIFPHGIQYFDEILKILYKYPDLELLYFRRYVPYDFIQFIEDIYKTDTVPWEHIRGKTQYLHNIGKDVWVMLIKNHKPEEVWVGEGLYRHKQCMLVNRFKWEVRERFNPVINGERSEHHVIHATDYEEQTLELWPKFQFNNIESISTVSNPLFPHIPFFIGEIKDFSIENIDINYLSCYEMRELGPNVRIPIKDSVYYKYALGDKEPYKKYWNEMKGIRLWLDNSPMKFDKLITEFDHERVAREYMVVSEDNVIIDGNHRASILLSKGINKIPVIKIKQWHPIV